MFCALPIACATRHSAQNIAFHEVGRQAVMADPEWRGGRYLIEGANPRRGLAVARMGAHITYLSDAALHRKFGRKFQDRDNPTFSFDADFEVESYLRHQGSSFVERFDANSYLYLTRAMDYFDLAADCDGVVANAFRGAQTRFCVVSFTSDWLFPTSESRAIVHALNASGARVSFAEIVTDKGHDAFLLDEPELFAIVRGFLDGAAKARGLAPREMRDAVAAQARSDHGRCRPRPGRRALRLAAGRRDGGARRAGARRRLRRRRIAAASGETRGVDGRGIELSREGVNECVAKGLAVIQGDADTDLADYPDDAFDYVILSQTLQATRRPRVVLEHMLRIGRHAVVSFPNFGHWKIRLQVGFGGHMPQTDNLPYSWWDSPNIHFCTIKDFRDLCAGRRRQDGAGGGAQRLGQAAALQRAVVVLEFVRRAGGVPAEPERLKRHDIRLNRFGIPKSVCF